MREFNDILVAYTNAPEDGRELFDPPKSLTVTLFNRDVTVHRNIRTNQVWESCEILDEISFIVPLGSYVADLVGKNLRPGWQQQTDADRAVLAEHGWDSSEVFWTPGTGGAYSGYDAVPANPLMVAD